MVSRQLSKDDAIGIDEVQRVLVRAAIIVRNMLFEHHIIRRHRLAERISVPLCTLQHQPALSRARLAHPPCVFLKLCASGGCLLLAKSCCSIASGALRWRMWMLTASLLQTDPCESFYERSAGATALLYSISICFFFFNAQRLLSTTVTLSAAARLTLRRFRVCACSGCLLMRMIVLANITDVTLRDRRTFVLPQRLVICMLLLSSSLSV
jgi:hypothetical protein